MVVYFEFGDHRWDFKEFVFNEIVFKILAYFSEFYVGSDKMDSNGLLLYRVIEKYFKKMKITKIDIIFIKLILRWKDFNKIYKKENNIPSEVSNICLNWSLFIKKDHNYLISTLFCKMFENHKINSNWILNRILVDNYEKRICKNYKGFFF